MGLTTYPRDVIGPTSSTDNAIVRFDSTTGKLIQNSTVTLSDTGAFAAASGTLTLTSPALTTPTLGVAGATSVNKWVFTAPTTAATLTPGADNVVSTTPSTTGTLINRVEVPYDLACLFVGVPSASAVGLRFAAVRAFTLSASGQQGKAGTAATAQTDFVVAVNGVTKATLRFAAAATTCSVVGGTAATIATADIITVTAPGSADATLADIGLTLTGVLI